MTKAIVKYLRSKFNNGVQPKDGILYFFSQAGQAIAAVTYDDQEALNEIYQESSFEAIIQAILAARSNPLTTPTPITVLRLARDSYDVYIEVQKLAQEELASLREIASRIIETHDADNENDFTSLHITPFEHNDPNDLDLTIIDKSALESYIAQQELMRLEQPILRRASEKITTLWKRLCQTASRLFKSQPDISIPAPTDDTSAHSTTIPQSPVSICGGGGRSAGHSATAQHQPVEPSEQFMHR